MAQFIACVVVPAVTVVEETPPIIALCPQIKPEDSKPLAKVEVPVVELIATVPAEVEVPVDEILRTPDKSISPLTTTPFVVVMPAKDAPCRVEVPVSTFKSPVTNKLTAVKLVETLNCGRVEVEAPASVIRPLVSNRSPAESNAPPEEVRLVKVAPCKVEVPRSTLRSPVTKRLTADKFVETL